MSGKNKRSKKWKGMSKKQIDTRISKTLEDMEVYRIRNHLVRKNKIK